MTVLFVFRNQKDPTGSKLTWHTTILSDCIGVSILYMRGGKFLEVASSKMQFHRSSDAVLQDGFYFTWVITVRLEFMRPTNSDYISAEGVCHWLFTGRSIVVLQASLFEVCTAWGG